MLRTVIGSHAKCAVLLDPKRDPLLRFPVPRKAGAARKHRGSASVILKPGAILRVQKKGIEVTHHLRDQGGGGKARAGKRARNPLQIRAVEGGADVDTDADDDAQDTVDAHALAQDPRDLFSVEIEIVDPLDARFLSRQGADGAYCRH